MASFNQIEQLVYQGKFSEALEEVEDLELKSEGQKNERLQCQILKSLILTRKGDPDSGLLLINQVFQEIKQLNNSIMEVDAYLSKVTALYELGELDECLKEIELAEKRLSTIKNQIKTTQQRSAILHFKGKILRKKGDLGRALEYLQESLSIRQELDHSYEIADILNTIGIVYSSRGELYIALEYLQQSQSIFEELGQREQLVKVLNNIGMAAWQSGELDQALDSFQRSLYISQELGNTRFIAVLLLNIGLIYRNKGELNSALYFYQKGLSLFEELGKKREITVCLNNIGEIYYWKGELDRSLQFYNQSLVLAEELENKEEIALSFLNIGSLFEAKGELNIATNYYKKSLSLTEEIGKNPDTVLVLYNLIIISVYQGLIDECNSYLTKLKEIKEKETNKLISQRFRLAKAAILKSSSRVIKRAEAQQLFQQVAHEEIINIELTIFALLNLCELLLMELRSTGNEEILSEVKTLLGQLLEITENQHSFIWLTETYLLQSKLALLELDLNQAQALLSKAEQLADEMGLSKLTTTITLECDLIQSQIRKWEKIMGQKPSAREIVELTQFEKLLERMIFKKLYCKEEEIQEYAEKARTLVEKWEKYL